MAADRRPTDAGLTTRHSAAQWSTARHVTLGGACRVDGRRLDQPALMQVGCVLRCRRIGAASSWGEMVG